MRLLFHIIIIFACQFNLHPQIYYKFIPVLHEGRIKPLDTVARHALLILHGSQTINDQSAIDWILDVLMNSKKAKGVPLIRIENPELLRMLGNRANKRSYYSINDLQPHFKQIHNLASQIANVDEKQRDIFQNAAIALWQQITIYLSLSNTLWIAEIENVSQEFQAFKLQIQSSAHFASMDWYKLRYQFLSDAAYFRLLPPNGHYEKWMSMGEGLLAGMNEKAFHPSIFSFVNSIYAYQTNRYPVFNQIIHHYLHEFNTRFPHISWKIRLEVWNNTLQPFFLSIIFYLITLALTIAAWHVHSQKLIKASLILFFVAFLIHTLGLIARMVIEGRPPVTNLYSSAIFVGWGAVLLSLLIEAKSRIGIGCIVGTLIGALTLLFAQHLSLNGDTMEVLRAVLNSNFWLSTHVVAITLGYSSAFLAGGLGMIYILRGVLTRTLDDHTSHALSRFVYAAVCFSALLTFVGTMLGGFWADQSWGRFWGWDPKENGALLIILWNILILHTRVSGLIKKQGLMVLAVLGNIIVALSWFGVNLLSVGLHSYGFMQGTFFWLLLFIFSQCIIAAFGMLPKRLWRSPIH